MPFPPRSHQPLERPALRLVAAAGDGKGAGARGQDPAEDAFVDICLILDRLRPRDRARVLAVLRED